MTEKITHKGTVITYLRSIWISLSKLMIQHVIIEVSLSTSYHGIVWSKQKTITFIDYSNLLNGRWWFAWQFNTKWECTWKSTSIIKYHGWFDQSLNRVVSYDNNYISIAYSFGKGFVRVQEEWIPQTNKGLNISQSGVNIIFLLLFTLPCNSFTEDKSCINSIYDLKAQIRSIHTERDLTNQIQCIGR